MNLIKFLYLGVILFLNSLYAYGDNTMPLFSKATIFNQKPYFTLNFTVSGCIYEFRVNDVPIFGDPEGGYLTSSIPVNEWMLSGENTISMYLQPMNHAREVEKEGQNCRVSLSLQVRESGTPDTQNKVISQINYNSSPISLVSTETSAASSTATGSYIWDNGLKEDKKGNIILGNISLIPEQGKYGMGVVIRRTFTVPKLPFPKWAWANGENIVNNEQTHDELVKEYQQIWDAVKNKNISHLGVRFQLRSLELSQAYYLADSKKQNLELIEDLLSDSQNKKLVLGDFIPKYEFLKVFGNNKLARLAIWNGDPAIYFNYTDGSANISYDIIYAKINGKWVIVR